MSAKTRSLALIGILVHFLMVNLIATFGPFRDLPLGFRNLTMFFSAVLAVDILFVVNQLRRGKWDE